MINKNLMLVIAILVVTFKRSR